MSKLPTNRGQNASMSEEQKSAESQFGRCPKGHAIPHRTNKGNCTPLFCAGSKSGASRAEQKAKKEGLEPTQIVRQGVKELTTQDLGEVDELELSETSSRIMKASTRHKARLAFLKVPETFSDPKEREKWVEDKKQELLPLALADVEYSLKLGDQQERERARREVLDMTGHGKREGGGGSTSPLIMLVGVSGNPAENPWVRRVEAKNLPVTVQTIEVTK